MGAPKNQGLDTFPDPSVILGFAGSAALQAVSECLRRHKAGIAWAIKKNDTILAVICIKSKV